jgi:hypothetical protein
MRHVRKWVILSHRYLGIAMGLVFVMWFASGMVMMYAGGMPQMNPDLRRERLAPLDMSAVRLSPAEAAERAGVDDAQRASLFTVLGRPAYRFGSRTVFADTGDALAPVDRATAQAIAARFLDVPTRDIDFLHTVDEPDQWTLTLSRGLPFLKFRARDDAATELYVSPRTADVVLATTKRDRLLSWLGVIPHWLYFAPLRLNQPLWYDVVVGLSWVGVATAVVGLAVGVMRFKPSTPLRFMASIPYGGWMRWHFVTGAVFGVFTLTWVFSGLLSMEPFAWTNASGLPFDREVLSGGSLQLDRFTPADATTWGRLAAGRPIKEIELARMQDEPYYVVRLERPAKLMRRERLHQPYPIVGRAEGDRLIVAADTMTARLEPFSAQSLVARLTTAAPGTRVVEQTLLTDYDDYYYSRRGQTPLPVLRVKFDDPAQTWVYVDPAMNQVLTAIPYLARVERWFYNGLHSLDFAFWYRSWTWDVGMILLCLGGLASSTIGTVLGFGRVARAVRNGLRWVPRRGDVFAHGNDGRIP